MQYVKDITMQPEDTIKNCLSLWRNVSNKKRTAYFTCAKSHHTALNQKAPNIYTAISIGRERIRIQN